MSDLRGQVVGAMAQALAEYSGFDWEFHLSEAASALESALYVLGEHFDKINREDRWDAEADGGPTSGLMIDTGSLLAVLRP